MQLAKRISFIRTARALVRFGAGWRSFQPRKDILPYTLAAVAAAVTVWIAVELALPATAPLSEPAAEAAANLVQQPPAEGRAQMRQYISDITRRPLFKAIQKRPTPRGKTGPAVPAPVSPTLADDFELMGVVGGETPEAIIRNRRSGKTYNVTVGQVIDDVTIKEIAPRSVVLQIGASKVRIGL